MTKTVTLSDLHPDHLRLLELAQAAFQARDDRTAWRKGIANAAEAHGVACDTVWDELERQIEMQDGRIPVLEHPKRKQMRMVANLRCEIVNTAMAAIEGALNELAKGPMLEDEE